jgi:hypothetical protein
MTLDAAVLPAILTAAYTATRGWTKVQSAAAGATAAPGKPGWKTTEFWLVVLAWAQEIVQTFAGGGSAAAAGPQ